MRENNNKSFQEFETAFAASVLLINILILAALLSVGWLLYGLITQFGQFAYFLQVA